MNVLCIILVYCDRVDLRIIFLIYLLFNLIKKNNKEIQVSIKVL